MKTIEKIAMLWTAPIFFALTIATGAIASLFFLIRIVLVYSGTAGAAFTLISGVKKQFNSKKWQSLQKRDAMMAVIDKRVKMN